MGNQGQTSNAVAVLSSKSLLILAMFLHLTDASGFVTIQFLRYSSGGRTAADAQCDNATRTSGSYDPCDPQFRLTADRTEKGGRGLFVYQQSSFYSNQDTIDFFSTFGEQPNPLVLDMNYDDNQGSIWLAVSVTDNDSGTGGQLMGEFAAQLQVSGKETWTLELKSSTNQTLTLKYRYTCSANYYGLLCNTRCQASDNSDDGHSWCTSSGQKFCLYGWVEASTGCKKPHPCRTCVCQNGGICVAQGDGYTCQCQPDYTGSNCEHCDPGGVRQCSKQPDAGRSCDMQPIQGCPHAPQCVIGAGRLAGALIGAILAGFVAGCVAGCVCFFRSQKH